MLAGGQEPYNVEIVLGGEELGYQRTASSIPRNEYAYLNALVDLYEQHECVESY